MGCDALNSNMEPEARPSDAGASPLPDGCAPMSLSGCYRTRGFADCKDPSESSGDVELWCQSIECGLCYWFDEGCPAEGFIERCGAERERHCYAGASCVGGWGGIDSPWTRDREMNLLVIEETLVLNEKPYFQCDLLDESARSTKECYFFELICIEPDETDPENHTYKRVYSSKRDNLLTITNEITGRSYSGTVYQMIIVEVDLDLMRARACTSITHGASDTSPYSISDHEPFCAESGEVYLDWESDQGSFIIRISGCGEITGSFNI